jgi:hypothetical protein
MRLDTETSIVTHPKPPANWDGVDLTCEQTSRTRGVAVDFDGNVWVANYDCASTSKYDKDGNHLGTYDVGRGPLGMAVATDGRVWALNLTDYTATVLKPDTGELVKTVTGLNYPYSYSDMTGLQLRLVTRQGGAWTTTYDSEHALAKWYGVGLTATTPAGTHVCVKVRTAGSRAGLATATYTTPVCVPGEGHDASPYSIPIWHPAGVEVTPPAGSLFLGTPEAPTELVANRFLQLEVELKGDNGVSPIVDDLEVFWDRP